MATGSLGPLPGSSITPQKPAQGNIFRKRSDCWVIQYGDQDAIYPKHQKGLAYLRLLLQHPDTAIDVLRLVSIVDAALPSGKEGFPTVKQIADMGLSDAVAQDWEFQRSELIEKKRLISKLRMDLAAAEANTDHGQIKDLEVAIAFAEADLSKSQGLGGRPRPPQIEERARRAVSKALTEAMNAIGVHHPDLGAHLWASVRLGRRPKYAPTTRTPWNF
jgi:hypothetical protein